jgi:hypothetical protein
MVRNFFSESGFDAAAIRLKKYFQRGSQTSAAKAAFRISQ